MESFKQNENRARVGKKASNKIQSVNRCKYLYLACNSEFVSATGHSEINCTVPTHTHAISLLATCNTAAGCC